MKTMAVIHFFVFDSHNFIITDKIRLLRARRISVNILSLWDFASIVGQEKTLQLQLLQ